MIRYGWQKLAEVIAAPNLSELIQAQSDELSVFKDYPLAIDFDWMLYEEQAGHFRAFTARDGKTLAGWVAFVLAPYTHHRDTLFAKVDNYFLDPRYRHGQTGLNLLRRAFAAIEAAGAEIIIVHRKLHTDPLIGIFFERQGFRPIEMVYARKVSR